MLIRDAPAVFFDEGADISQIPREVFQTTGCLEVTELDGLEFQSILLFSMFNSDAR